MYVFFFIDFKLNFKTMSFLFDLFLFIDIFSSRGEGVSQWAKGFLCKHEDLSLSLQHPHQKLNFTVHTCNSVWGGRTRSCYHAESGSSRFSGRPLLKNYGGGGVCLRKTFDVGLWPPCASFPGSSS